MTCLFTYVIFFLCRSPSRFSSTNKTDFHDITEILLKVALNTISITLSLTQSVSVFASSPRWFKPKTIKLVDALAASPLNSCH
jgi:hypothetical protein